MEKTDLLRANHVVQLNPDKVANKAFAGCFMIISEPKPWGAQGYIQAFGTREKRGGQAYYRAEWEEMEYIGQAMWSVNDNEDT